MPTVTDDYARTLNPGFCAVLVATILQATRPRPGDPGPGLPLAAPYLLMPLVLNKQTAYYLVESRARGVQDFLFRHPDVIVGFDRRTRILLPFVRAGLACALRRGALSFDRRTHRLFPTDALEGKEGRIKELLGDEDVAAVKGARKVGRWATSIPFPYLCTLLSCKPTFGKVTVA